MPSSYTTSLRLTLPANGELAGSWGSTVNTGVTSLAEAAIAGTAAVVMTDADATLTVLNGAADQSRNMFITLTGTLTAARNVICPSVSKLYVVTNNTTGSQTITFKTSAGSGIAVASGQRKMLYCNGTNVLDATTGVTSLLFDAGTVSAPSIAFAGNTSTGFWLPTTSTLAASTAGVERLRIDASGNLSIGTTSTLGRLSVQTAAGSSLNVRDSLAVTGVTGAMLDIWDTPAAASSVSFAIRAADFRFGTDSAGTFVERLRIDSSGNLGLGVVPSAWSGLRAFEFAGVGSSLASAANNNLHLSANAWYNGTSWRYGITAAASQYQSFSGQHTWYNAPSGTAGDAITFTQAMTLDAAGALWVGNFNSLTAGGILLAHNAGADYRQVGHATGTASGAQFDGYYYAGGLIGSITQSGTTAVLYNTTSDQRLKDNVQNAPDASELIDAIQVRSFDWKSDGSHQRYGFVAQELLTVAPEAVSAPADPDEMMAVDYSKLVPMLIKEVQSLRARVAAMEAAWAKT